MKLLAIASNNDEARQLLAFAKEKMLEKENCLLLVFKKDERKRKVEKDIKVDFATVVEQANYLSKADKNFVEKKATHFIRNWYKFDKTFEKAIEFEGISLGFLSEQGIIIFFYDTFEQLKAVENAIKKEKPDIILTGRNSIAGKIVKAVGKKEKIPKVKFVDFEAEKSYRHWTSFTTTKARQITENTKNLLKDVFEKIGKNKKKHLVFFRGRGHYTKGVKQALSNEKDLDVYSLDEFLLKRFLKPKNLFGFIPLKKKLVVRFKKEVQAYEASKGFAKEMQFDGIPFAELFHWKISLFTEKFWPEFAFTIQELRSLFESKRPDALVLWSDFVSFERTCALIAREKKIPSFVIQHGVFWDENQKDDWIIGFVPLIVDYIAVWGPVFKKILIKKKVSPKRVAVIGIPRMDFLVEKKFNAKAFKKKINVKEEDRLIVMAYGSGRGNLHKLIKMVSVTLRKFPNTKLVLKMHPVEIKNKYERIIQDIGKNAIVLYNENLYELLDSAEAIITIGSTTGLEAMVLGKPVIIFPNEGEDFSIYRNTNAVLRASNQKELENSLKLVFDKGKEFDELEKNMQKFVFDYGFKQDGMASQRFVKLVKKKAIKQAKVKKI